MKPTSISYFRKSLRKYQRLQKRVAETHSPRILRTLSRKLNILQRRLLRLNWHWKLGLSTSALILGLAVPAQAQVFPANLNLSELDGNNGFIITGIDVSDYSGISVSGAGDVNDDGIDDFIIGAQGADPNGVDFAGESYVVFGTGSFPDSLNLSALDGSNGFVIRGIAKEDRSGISVSRAGDLNDDGRDDIIIGADFADPNGNFKAGETYVIFGNSSFPASLELSDLNGSNGFTISGINIGDNSGYSVSETGDVNGDGWDDIVIGARGATSNGEITAGESYVIFGDSSFSAKLNLSTLNGSNGFVIRGIDTKDRSGRSVSGAGDINGDGLNDIIIGAAGAAPHGKYGAGESYVVFGASNFADSLNLSALDGNNGFVILGVDAYDASGGSVSGAGDVNGDGLDDLIIGATGGDPNDTPIAGESYVVFGTNNFPDSLSLSSLDGSNGFVINGINAYDASGRSVSGAGDVNGDGIDDILIGAVGADPGGNSHAGESYVVFGDSTFADTLNLSALDGHNGLVIRGIDHGDYSSFSLSGAGDVNGDGIDDIIIGAYYADPDGKNKAGESYVIFGRDVNSGIEGQLVPSLSLELIPNPTAGIIYLRTESLRPAASMEIRLYDLLGRTMPLPYTRVAGDSFVLDLRTLPPATYLLRLQADEEIGMARIVRQ